MSQAQLPPTPNGAPGRHAAPSGHGGHRWMMLACCVPMLAVAVVLVATGVAGAGLIVAAVVCTLMMALLMGGTGRGDQDDHHGR